MPHRSPSSFDFTAIETLVRQHFLHIITKVAGLAHLIDFDPSQPLDISQYPAAQRALDKLLQQLHNDLSVGISSSMWQAWETANDNMDALVLKHLPKAPDAYFLRNHEALQALLSRKERGLDLSQRVWRITQQFEEEVTMALDLGLRNGEDAATLARTLRQHLNQPDKLFRRVRDEHGMLHLSKRAKAYHPGQGVYRSSFKNARRLAATETNMAYRAADYERWQQLDFVVGIRIELSNNHTCLGADGKPHRFHDICDDLQGKYPKDFKFTGWHPHCRCHATPILKTPEEMDRDDEAILRGERPSSESQNTVHTPPPALDKWMEKNKDRIAASKARGTLPYFIKDNKAVFGLEEKKKTTPPKTEKKQEKKTEKFDYDKPNAALDNYISGEGMWVNNYLRGRSDMGELYPDEKEYLAQLTKATSIERVGERTLWRSVDAQAVFGEKLSDGDFEDLRSHYLYGQTHKVILQKIDPYLHLEGKIIEEKGFMSTTKSEEIAKEFGNYTGSRRPVLLKIKTNEHTMGVDVERYTLKHRPEVEQREPQKEVLLQRGQRMRVLSVGDRDGHLCVEVELVNQQAKVVAKKTPLDIAKERIDWRKVGEKIIGKMPKDSIADLEEVRAILAGGDDKEQNEIVRFLNRKWYDLKRGAFFPGAGGHLSFNEYRAISKNNKEISKILGMKKGSPMTIEKADQQSANPHLMKGKAYRINCQTCVPAYMLRLRGFNVTARGNVAGSLSEWISRGHSFDIWDSVDGKSKDVWNTIEWMEKKKYASMSPKRYKQFFEEATPTDGVYVLTIRWKGKGGAHATILQRINGKLYRVEPQSYNGEVLRSIDYLIKEGSRYPHSTAGIMRIDNKKFKTEYLSIFDKAVKQS